MASKAKSRRVTRPAADLSILPISLGGTGSSTAAGARTNLDMVGKSEYDIPGGTAKVGTDGKLPLKYVPDGLGNTVASVEASNVMVAGKETTIDITDYSSFKGDYVINVTGGSYRREDSRIVVTPDLGATTVRVVIDSTSYDYVVTGVGVNKPSIVGHRVFFAGATVFAKSSDFSTNGLADTHESTSWEFCQNRTFAKDFLYYSSYMDTVNKDVIYMSMEVKEEVYVRVRHHSSTGYVSDWSDPYLIKTKDNGIGFTPMGVPEGETAKLSVAGRSLGEGHMALSGFGNVLITSMEAYDGSRDTELSIWRRMSTGWKEMTRIKASDYGYAPNSGWGERFDIHPEGKWFAVAAPYHGVGVVQVYSIVNGQVVPGITLTSPMAQGGKFGWSLKYLRDRLVVMEHDYNYVPGVNTSTIQRTGALFSFPFSLSGGVDNTPSLRIPNKAYDFYRDIVAGGYMPTIAHLTTESILYPQRVAVPGRNYYFNQGSIDTRNDFPWFEKDGSSDVAVSTTEYLIDRWTSIITDGAPGVSVTTDPRISSEPGVNGGGRITYYQAAPWVSPNFYYLSDYQDFAGGSPGPVVAPYDGSFSAFTVHGLAGGDGLGVLYTVTQEDETGNWLPTTVTKLLPYDGRAFDYSFKKNLVGSYAGHILAVAGKLASQTNTSIHVFETATPVDLDATGWVPIPESNTSGQSTGGGSANNHGWWWCGTPNTPF